MLDLWSNTHRSWSGMSLTASAPNALSPFLPTLIEALERQEHLHFSDECRSQLLSMSAARGSAGLSTTCAGTLLKQQIPIRTFKEWNETQLGLTFERNGRAHCDADREGGYPYTRTLNDIVFPLDTTIHSSLIYRLFSCCSTCWVVDNSSHASSAPVGVPQSSMNQFSYRG